MNDIMFRFRTKNGIALKTLYGLIGLGFCISYVISIVAGFIWWGSVTWLISVLLLMLVSARRRYALFVLALALIVMSIVPVGTSTSPWTGLPMLLGMAFVVYLPFLMKSLHQDYTVDHFHITIKKLKRSEIKYIVFPLVQVVPVLFFYFFTTNTATHWNMTTPYDIAVTFSAIMIIGVWEELFFVATVFGILRRYLPFAWASLLQAVAFTGFLYQVGFTGWIVIFLFYYTLYQVWAYHKTKNLLVTLIIHAVVDLAVFLAIFLVLQAG